jgi:hypothetical protein
MDKSRAATRAERRSLLRPAQVWGIDSLVEGSQGKSRIMLWDDFKRRTGWTLGPWETAAIIVGGVIALAYGIPAYFAFVIWAGDRI